MMSPTPQREALAAWDHLADVVSGRAPTEAATSTALAVVEACSPEAVAFLLVASAYSLRDAAEAIESLAVRLRHAEERLRRLEG